MTSAAAAGKVVAARKQGGQGKGAGEGIFVLREGRQQEEGGSRRAAVVVVVPVLSVERAFSLCRFGRRRFAFRAMR